MYRIEELESKSREELVDIAKEFGVECKKNTPLQEVIYAILDRQAEVGSTQTTTTAKRKRTRITKESSDKVYTVKGKNGENLEPKTKKTKTKKEIVSFCRLLMRIVINCDCSVKYNKWD